jgi:hypothetical protein
MTRTLFDSDDFRALGKEFIAREIAPQAEEWEERGLPDKAVYKAARGYGYMLEYPVARAYQDVRISTILGGTTEIMKEIIGRDLGC